MGTSKYVMDAIMAVASGFAQKGVEITIDRAKLLIEEICKKDPSPDGQINVEEMAQKIQTAAHQVGHVTYNEETLARFLEIPVPDLATVNPETIDLDVLYNHVKLEGEFQGWLNELGYEVELGSSLTGLRGVEYIPDVYGSLNTDVVPIVVGGLSATPLVHSLCHL